MASRELIQALAATAELCGAKLSEAAAQVLIADLSEYPEAHVIEALSRVRKSGKRFSPGAIIEEINRNDGRPGAEEAWAMLPTCEEESTVWTEEMRSAWGVAVSLIEAGDKVGARMAFKEAYQRKVEDSRTNKVPVKWEVSLGLDPYRREEALNKAVRAGYLTQDQVSGMLPYHSASGPVAALLSNGDPKLLIAAQPTEEEKAKALARLKQLKDVIARGGAVKKVAADE